MNKDTWMPIAFPPYHVTMVVDDVKAAMADMTRLFGLQWAPLQGDGLFTYSLQGPPYLELLKRRDDTIFDTAGLHHIGLWVDDVNAEAARLEAEGCEAEFVHRDAQGNVLGDIVLPKTYAGMKLFARWPDGSIGLWSAHRIVRLPFQWAGCP